MSGLSDDSNRQVIPRWLTYDTARWLGCLAPNSQEGLQLDLSDEQFERVVFNWRRSSTMSYAMDLLGTALVRRDLAGAAVQDAAKFVMVHEHRVSSLASGIARHFIESETPIETSAFTRRADANFHVDKIRYYKKLTRLYPRNAIAWASAAYHYVMVGKPSRAERNMDIALSLGYENRFILRSASRCLLHLEDPEKALHFLRKSTLVSTDPWIVATEIALSEGIRHSTSSLMTGRKLMSDSNLSPWSTNELAAVLSTFELRHGTKKRAKKLLRQALIRPNENTLAQAEWLAERMNIEISHPASGVLASFEAIARSRHRAGSYEAALSAAKQWADFQPFASRPLVLASYLASVCLEDYEECIQMLELAKGVSSESFLIQNNLAFALASLDRVLEANKVFGLVDERTLSEREKTTALATKGLVSFRQGNYARGRDLYLEAINQFENTEEFPAASIAAYFLLREENRVRSDYALEASSRAITLAKKYDVKDILFLLDKHPGGPPFRVG